MYLHPHISYQLATLREDELHREAARARLAARVRTNRREGARRSGLPLAGRSFLILRRHRISSVPRPQL